MRPTWDEYFMGFAILAAERGTCLKAQVGAIIVDPDKRIISTGYNGAPRGIPHCEDVGCSRLGIESGTRHELCRGVHAEQNTVIQAARQGTSVKDCSVYSTFEPCSICLKILINAGICEVVYMREYPDELSKKLRAESDITMREFKWRKQSASNTP